MSFDLGVFHSTRPLDEDAAQSIYDRLGEGEDPETVDGLGPSARVDEFLAVLSASYPDLDTLPEDALGDSPWSCGFSSSASYVLLMIRWSRAAEMFVVVQRVEI